MSKNIVLITDWCNAARRKFISPTDSNFIQKSEICNSTFENTKKASLSGFQSNPDFKKWFYLQDHEGTGPSLCNAAQIKCVSEEKYGGGAKIHFLDLSRVNTSTSFNRIASTLQKLISDHYICVTAETKQSVFIAKDAIRYVHVDGDMGTINVGRYVNCDPTELKTYDFSLQHQRNHQLAEMFKFKDLDLPKHAQLQLRQ